jgi:glycerol uptake facilitator-like aquaporin
VLQVVVGGKYDLAHLIVYFVGPIVGGILGVLVYDFMVRARTVPRVEIEAASSD